MVKENTKIPPMFDDETLKHLQNVEFMILKDFITLCEKYDIEYYSYGGTALGAIRHEGFIPWDDDVDVVMFREDYEKLLKIPESEYSNKYYFLSIEKYEDYIDACCKMCLKGTDKHELYCRNAEFNIGIHIDIFVLDYVPSNKIKWFFYYKRYQLLKKMGRLINNLRISAYTTNTRKIIGNTIKSTLNLLHINNHAYIKAYEKLVKKSNPKDKLVFDIFAVCYNEPLSEGIFRPPKKVKFESIEINVPNEIDTFLKRTFGDYMKLPPEEERYHHFSENIDFGEY